MSMTTRLGGAVRLADLSRLLRAVARPRHQHRQPIPAGRQDHAVVRHGALHHGHAGQRHHLHLHHRPGLRGWHALRAVLFRAAARDGDPLATAVPIFHRAKVYTAYEYLEQRFDAKTRALVSVDLPDPARACARAGALRAGDRAVGDPRLAGPRHHPADGRTGGHLHGHRAASRRSPGPTCSRCA